MAWVITSRTASVSGRRPAWPYHLDEDNPIVKDLAGCWLPGPFLEGLPNHAVGYRDELMLSRGSPSVVNDDVMGPVIDLNSATPDWYESQTALEGQIGCAQSALTVCSWYYPDVTTQCWLASQGAGSKPWRLQTDTRFRALLRTDTEYQDNGPDNQIQSDWNFAVLRYNGSGLQAWCNGDTEGTPTSCSGDTYGATTAPICIGRQYENALFPFDGRVGSLLVWHRALSEEEIDLLYQANTRWCFLRPLGRVVYYDATESTGAAQHEPDFDAASLAAGAIALAVTRYLVASASILASGAVALSVERQLAPAASAEAQGAVVLSVTRELAPAASAEAQANVAVSTTRNLVVSATALAAGDLVATLGGEVEVSVQGSALAAGSVAIAVTRNIAVAGSVIASGDIAVTFGGQNQIEPAASALAAGAIVLAVTRRPAAVASAQPQGAIVISVVRALTVSAQAIGAATLVVTTQYDVPVVISGSSIAAATIQVGVTRNLVVSGSSIASAAIATELTRNIAVGAQAIAAASASVFAGAIFVSGISDVWVVPSTGRNWNVPATGNTWYME